MSHTPADPDHRQRIHEVGDGIVVDGVAHEGEMYGIDDPAAARKQHSGEWKPQLTIGRRSGESEFRSHMWTCRGKERDLPDVAGKLGHPCCAGSRYKSARWLGRISCVIWSVSASRDKEVVDWYIATKIFPSRHAVSRVSCERSVLSKRTDKQHSKRRIDAKAVQRIKDRRGRNE